MTERMKKCAATIGASVKIAPEIGANRLFSIVGQVIHTTITLASNAGTVASQRNSVSCRIRK